jgi:hypothetical protein
MELNNCSIRNQPIKNISTTIKARIFNMIKKISIILTTLMIIHASVIAQKSPGVGYSTALGIKYHPGVYKNPLGVTFKQRVAYKQSIEALAFFWKGARFTTLYEFHNKIEGIKGLRWYWGPGVHVTFYDQNYYDGTTNLGVDGVVGLDLKFNNSPINLALDWQPSIDFNGGAGFYAGFGGLSIRYVLK